MTDKSERRESPPGAGEFPALTIIIPAATDALHVRRILTELAGQDYPKDKIEALLTDFRSPSPLTALVGEFSDRLPGIRLLSCDSPHVSRGRNLALKNSSAPYVLMLDERVSLKSDRYLQDVVVTFLRTSADCICRPRVYLADDNYFARAVALASESYIGTDKASNFDGEGEVTRRPCGAYYRRSVFDKIGAYDEAFDMCDDLDFNYRAAQSGLKRWFAPSLKVSRYAEDSPAQLWRRIFRLGAGRYLFGHKHKKYSLMHFLAPVGTIALVMFAFFGILNGFRGLGSFEFAFNIYAIIALTSSALIILREKKLVYAFSLPLIFPVIHLALGSGFLMAWFKDMRSRRKLHPAATAPVAPAPPTLPTPPANPSAD